MWMLLSSGYGARVYGHVPLPRVAVSRPWCIGSAIGASGGGGLVGRATTASITVVVLAVVATTIAAVTVFIVVFFGCHHCRHWAGKMAWRVVAWLQEAQHWYRESSGQPEHPYYACGSPPVADHPEL
jgi:hypothetical protein